MDWRGNRTSRIDDDQEALIATILAEAEQVWSEISAASNMRHEEPLLVLYTGGAASGCGLAQAAHGPLCCSGDRHIDLDTAFFRVMELHAGGDGAVSDSVTHGTWAQRKSWLKAGFRSGYPGQCDTFSTRSPS